MCAVYDVGAPYNVQYIFSTTAGWLVGWLMSFTLTPRSKVGLPN
jgi:hypothetical protein